MLGLQRNGTYGHAVQSLTQKSDCKLLPWQLLARMRVWPNYSPDSSDNQTLPPVRGRHSTLRIWGTGLHRRPGWDPRGCLHFYLHGQAECVEHDEDKHHVLERRGVHHVPELVLVGVFGDVSSQGTCFQGVFNTLTLQGQKRATGILSTSMEEGHSSRLP